mmetsp:Transcript_37163/g.89374  ORF Transcript_37163/g.89374 Transcript_37163/m.89374 type:complete len:209 (-) Transcript_37163:77-703(-)
MIQGCPLRGAGPPMTVRTGMPVPRSNSGYLRCPAPRCPQPREMIAPPRVDLPDWTPPAFHGNLPKPDSPSSKASGSPQRDDPEEQLFEVPDKQDDVEEVASLEASFPLGAVVEYFSTTHQLWIKAVVQGHNKTSVVLDCQAKAKPEQIRLVSSKSPISLASTVDDGSGMAERLEKLEHENVALHGENEFLKSRLRALEARLASVQAQL